MSLSWAIVSDRPCVNDHVEALSAALKKAGVENSARIINATPEALGETIAQLRTEKVRAIRLEGSLPGFALAHFSSAPSNLRILKSADTICFDENGDEWLKSVMYDGFSRFIAHELKTIDLTGAAIVVGTGTQSNAIIAALARVGFNRILIVGDDDSDGTAYVDSLKHSFFGVNFQYTPRQHVMNLPGVHSVAVNTIRAVDDSTGLAELFYFNFLKPGAFWVEVPYERPNSALIQEANNAGAIVKDALDLLVHLDWIWAETCFKCHLNAAEYRADLEARLNKK